MRTAPRHLDPPGAELSPYQKRFYDFVDRHPEGFERRLFAAAEPVRADDRAIEGFDAPAQVQPWPTFLDSARAREQADISVRLFALVRDLLRSFFAQDPHHLCQFYGLDLETAEHLGQLLELSRKRATAMMRGDFLFSERGLQLLEVNAYANLGGLHIASLARAFLKIPYLQQFFKEQRVIVRLRDPWRILLAHMVDHAVRRDLPRDGSLNLAILISEPALQNPRYIEPAFTSVLQERAPGIRGKILICKREQLGRDGDTLRAQGEPVQIVLCYYITCPVLPMPIEVEAWLDGVVDLYPGPMGYIYSDKRNLALLSEGVERGLFTGEDASLIDHHVPWTRLVKPGTTDYRGEPWELERLLLEKREAFVLKPAQGFGGGGIVIGRFTAPEAWREHVLAAFGYETMSVQEFIVTSPQRVQSSSRGSSDGLMNWGLFVFDDRFGGTYLRSSPALGHEGFISTSIDAEKGCCFELAPAGEHRDPGDLLDEVFFNE